MSSTTTAGRDDSRRGRLLNGLGQVTLGVMAVGIPTLSVPGLADAYVLPRAILVLIGGAICLAVAILLRQLRFGPLMWPGLLVAVAALVAGIFSIDPTVSFLGAPGRLDGVAERLGYLALFVAAVSLLRTGKDRTRLVSLFLLGCAAIAVDSIAQSLATGGARADANLGSPILLGALLAMALPLVVARGLRNWRWLGLMPLLSAGLVVSGTRSAWLGAFMGLSAILLLTIRQRRVLAASAAGVVVVVVVSLGIAITPLRDLNQDPGTARIHVWSDAVHMAWARPITGWGEDTMGEAFGTFVTGDWEHGVSFDRAHSEPIDLWIAQGAIGLAAIGWFWITWWKHLMTERRRDEIIGIMGLWVAYAFWALLNFDWVAATGPLWLFAAVAWSSGYGVPERSRRTTSGAFARIRRPRLRRAVTHPRAPAG
jgi:hypothetical protein